MRKYFSFFRVLVILVVAVLLVTFFWLSINRYKTSYVAWQDRFERLRLTVRELDVAAHKVRSGRRFDFDQLTEKELQMVAVVTDFSVSLKSAPSEPFDLWSAWKVNQKEISLDVEPLVKLCIDSAPIANTFKTSFSMLRNSEIIVFQLIDDLQPMIDAHPSMKENFSALKKSLLELSYFKNDVYRQDVDAELADIKQKFTGVEWQEVQQFVGFIEKHLEVIYANTPVVEGAFKQGESFQKRLAVLADRLQKELRDQYDTELQRSVRYSYLFLFVAFVVLASGATFSRKAYLLRNQLAAHNRDLEKLVHQRTANLENAKTRLQLEKNERETLLVQLDESKNKLDAIINTIHGCVYEYDAASGKFLYISKGIARIWGERADSVGNIADLTKKIHPEDIELRQQQIDAITANSSVVSVEYRIQSGENTIWARELCSAKLESGVVKSLVGVVVDITEFKQAGQEKKRIEEELLHAQKLESVGQLAAGIAHEINTPAQFISDNLVFLQDSVADVLKLVGDLREEVKASGVQALAESVESKCEEVDLEYLEGEITPALVQSYEGISSIARIIRAMKDYSHPGESIELADINKAIDSTVTISRSEWKYFAVLETEFEEGLPMVECVVSDINQVVLNMIVNASHAIVERYDDPDNLEGRIGIKTKSLEDKIAIEISDNGAGMPESVKSKIFDHFFTTKGVGKGTGQGLSLAYRMIVEKHGGKIEVDSTVGVGTTFRILLPVKQSGADSEEQPEQKL
ncbi:MAG: PAS domain S-box protein [Pseudomonadales bacterium]|nr:PAS domain S-box protein [Pseudomonadales bacterium]MCP5172622.1 PAS domain S-box protein [Pseudomonadales bacterium]MCP5302096.1 PAS domain S-box protein [Pseudomonadales bacterium]